MKKCIICGREFDKDADDHKVIEDICDECKEARAELTNGKEEEKK